MRLSMGSCDGRALQAKACQVSLNFASGFRNGFQAASKLMGQDGGELYPHGCASCGCGVEVRWEPRSIILDDKAYSARDDFGRDRDSGRASLAKAVFDAVRDELVGKKPQRDGGIQRNGDFVDVEFQSNLVGPLPVGPDGSFYFERENHVVGDVSNDDAVSLQLSVAALDFVPAVFWAVM